MWMEKINSMILLFFISFCSTDSSSLGCNFCARWLCINMPSQYIATWIVVKKDGNQWKGGWYNENGRISLLITTCSSPLFITWELSQHCLVPQFHLYLNGHMDSEICGARLISVAFFLKNRFAYLLLPLLLSSLVCKSRMLSETIWESSCSVGHAVGYQVARVML